MSLLPGYGTPRSDSDSDEPPAKLWAHLGQGEPAVAKRERVLVEIMDTEEAYINDLKNCIQFVIDPLDIQSQTSIPIIPAEDVKSIFATIPLVYDLNKKLFDLLCQRIARWSTRDEIGDIFSQFAPMLKMYIAFVSNYGQSVKRIATLKKEHPWFASFVQHIQKNKAIRGLESYLILPVQRLPRYVLLLREMQKHTPKNHSDHALLGTAIANIVDTASHVNRHMHQQENGLKILEIQNSFSPPVTLLEAGRNFVMEGDLKKMNRSGDVEQGLTFFLFSDILIYGKKIRNGKYSFRRMLQLKDVIRMSPDTFKVIGREKHVIAMASGPAECKQWVDAILGVKAQVEKIKKKKKIIRSDSSEPWNKKL